MCPAAHTAQGRAILAVLRGVWGPACATSLAAVVGRRPRRALGQAWCTVTCSQPPCAWLHPRAALTPSQRLRKAHSPTAQDSDIYGGGVSAGAPGSRLERGAETLHRQQAHNPGTGLPRRQLQKPQHHRRGPGQPSPTTVTHTAPTFEPLKSVETSATTILRSEGTGRSGLCPSPRGPADQPHPTETTHSSWRMDIKPGSFIYTVRVTSKFLRLEQL